MIMEKMQNRLARELDSRTKAARPVYRPPNALPDPIPAPGFVYRWVATSLLGQSLATNVSTKLREGWVPVKAEDHPELQLAPNAQGNVEIGGLMLCKIPKELADARNDYYSGQAQNQMDSVDNHFMRNNDPRMPLFADRKSTSSRGGFGNGS
jgi:hypothetical protein